MNVPHRGLSNYSKNVCHDISSPVLFSSVKLLTVKPTESKEINPKRHIASEGKQDYSYVSRSLYFRLTKIKHLTTFQSLKYAECLRVYARITEL